MRYKINGDNELLLNKNFNSFEITHHHPRLTKI